MNAGGHRPPACGDSAATYRAVPGTRGWCDHRRPEGPGTVTVGTRPRQARSRSAPRCRRPGANQPALLLAAVGPLQPPYPSWSESSATAPVAGAHVRVRGPAIRESDRDDNDLLELVRAKNIAVLSPCSSPGGPQAGRRPRLTVAPNYGARGRTLNGRSVPRSGASGWPKIIPRFAGGHPGPRFAARSNAKRALA